LNWINQPSPYCSGCSTIANFTGVPQNKLLIGVPASQTAGNLPPSGQTIDSFKGWMTSNNYSMLGAFIWDSHWDALNQYNMSNLILTSSSTTPLTPNPPTTPSICSSTSSSTSMEVVSDTSSAKHPHRKTLLNLMI